MPSPASEKQEKLRYCCIVLHHDEGTAAHAQPWERGDGSEGGGRARGGGGAEPEDGTHGGRDAGPPPPPAQLQRGAAGTTPGRIPGTVTRRAGPCQRRPRSQPARARERAPENTLSAAHSAPTPAPRARCALPEGGGGRGREEESAPLRRRWGRAAASLWSPPPPAPHHPTQAPRAPPPPACALHPPRPHARAQDSDGQTRPSALGPRPPPARCRRGARSGGSPTAHAAPARLESRTSGASALSQAEALPGPSRDSSPAMGTDRGWPGCGVHRYRRCSSRETMGALSARPARANFTFNLRLI
ncbi:atherin-like [Cynocephalus volans]|uniref:atherin-like n=1 Tax=Cynocephalus volans TaxID=110931 RepID=UPI002FCC3FE7